MPNCTALTRRSLLIRSGLFTAAGSLGFMSVILADEAAAAESGSVFDCDVAVIGAGSAGLTAAIFAAERGARVLVLEKMNMVGGNSMLSEDAVTAIDDPRDPQWSESERNDIRRERAKLLEEMRQRGRTADPTLDARMVDESLELVEWLRSLGCELMRANSRHGARHVWEYRAPAGQLIGNEMIRQLLVRAEGVGVPVITGARVVELHRKASGCELQATTPTGGRLIVNAKTAIIASGGYAGSLDAVRRNCPNCPRLLTTNSPGATGDGLDLARQAGAALIDVDAVMLHPTTHALTGTIISRPLRMNGAILVNNRGERFVNELDSPETVARAILDQPGACAWLICDSEALDHQLVERLRASASITSCTSVAELADALSIAEADLRKTIDECRSTLAMTGRFARPRAASRFVTPPYYSIRIRPAVHGSLGGIRVDHDARALDAEGRPIPGVYAAGETTGGVYGRARFDNFGLIGALVYGRIAGINAAREATDARAAKEAACGARSEPLPPEAQ